MSASTAGTPRSVRILMWTLLIVYIFNFLDRQIVNILAEEISRDLQLSASPSPDILTCPRRIGRM